MKKMLTCSLIPIIVALSGCDSCDTSLGQSIHCPPKAVPKTPTVSDIPSVNKKSNSVGGLGMRIVPRPGVGITIAPGIVYGLDGSIGPGIGF